MAPPSSLPDELLAEILLRLPPDEPSHLFRAALVCKRWLRAICDPAFLRGYRRFHGSPPLLGLLHRRMVMQGDPEPRLVRTTAAPLSPEPPFRRALDCRHGRVLLHCPFVVWDPVTGDQNRLLEAGIPWLIYSAAVFCAVTCCDHLDCHGGPFRVVFIATDDDDELVKASVYSSETGAWTTPAILDDGFKTWEERFHARLECCRRGEYYRTPYVQPRRGALVGDAIYFTLRNDNAIIKYKWGTNCLSKIDPPSPHVYFIALMEMENGSLGFAYIEGSSLYVWSRNKMAWTLAGYGERLGEVGGFQFPTIERLARVSEQELREAGFGFRAKYIVGTAKKLQAEPDGGKKWLSSLRIRELPEVIEALCTLPGVGPKVAACIALFSLDQNHAFPVNTHVWKLGDRSGGGAPDGGRGDGKQDFAVELELGLGKRRKKN
uniref:F-box domain-containing protein n=1 Tax=Leersia perrieri TaxID=77586 RepID=A0A0D9VH01_9ORYZ